MVHIHLQRPSGGPVEIQEDDQRRVKRKNLKTRPVHLQL
jgi:hypothetical protein